MVACPVWPYLQCDGVRERVLSSEIWRESLVLLSRLSNKSINRMKNKNYDTINSFEDLNERKSNEKDKDIVLDR